jgi:lipoate-protein ligase A
VWVDPEALTWLEFVLPAGDELWTEDLGRSFDWLGRVMVEALDGLGHRTTVHLGPSRPGPWGRTICFAGLGPGEVLLGERKVVGMSQRRTRSWCRFGVAVLHHFAADRYAAAFGVPETDREAIEDHVGTVPVAGLVDAVVGSLP